MRQRSRWRRWPWLLLPSYTIAVSSLNPSPYCLASSQFSRFNPQAFSKDLTFSSLAASTVEASEPLPNRTKAAKELWIPLDGTTAA